MDLLHLVTVEMVTLLYATDVQHKIICKSSCSKKGKLYSYLLKLLRIELPTYENLLKVWNKRRALHSCSSYVEILENSI
jgi:hypothetical protein